MVFEWDKRKAVVNYRKHGVTFDEASTVFVDILSQTFADKDHSDYEMRFLIIGLSINNRVLVISHTDRDERIRIISAREATKKERLFYENSK